MALNGHYWGFWVRFIPQGPFFGVSIELGKSAKERNSSEGMGRISPMRFLFWINIADITKSEYQCRHAVVYRKSCYLLGINCLPQSFCGRDWRSKELTHVLFVSRAHRLCIAWRASWWGWVPLRCRTHSIGATTDVRLISLSIRMHLSRAWLGPIRDQEPQSLVWPGEWLSFQDLRTWFWRYEMKLDLSIKSNRI